MGWENSNNNKVDIISATEETKRWHIPKNASVTDFH